jgi:hypothetical protein
MHMFIFGIVKHNYAVTVIEISVPVKGGSHTRRCICIKTYFTSLLCVYAKPDDGPFQLKHVTLTAVAIMLYYMYSCV